MRKYIVLLLIIIFANSCDPDYDWHGLEWDYHSENGWKNDKIKIETTMERINDETVEYFKWYRNDTFCMEGYIKEYIDRYAKTKETYALLLLSNDYFTEFHKIRLDNYHTVLDVKWPRKTKDSLSMFEYERLEWY